MSLSNRIAEALTIAKTSAEVAPLVEEVRTAIASAEADVVKHRAAALNPTSIDTAVKAARAAMEDAQFSVDRLTVAETRLTERLADLRSAEEAAQRMARAEALAARQKAVREQFDAEYPILAGRLVSLAMEMEAAGLARELPHIVLGDGSAHDTGPSNVGFNQRQYWPLRPGVPFTEPCQPVVPDLSGTLTIVRAKKARTS